MKSVSFCFFCCILTPFFSSVIPLTTGKPLQSGSPERVFAAPGEHVVLPCRSTTPVHPSRITAVEWLRVDGPFPVTVHVERDGGELVKEKASEYLGRTAVGDDGSLKLLDVTQQDSGTYRCVLLRGAVAEDDVFVLLIVGEVPEVNITVRRTSVDKMFVLCESSGWILEPRISLLDARRMEVHAHTESSLSPDNLYSVRAQVEAAKGTETIVCRVEIPGSGMSKEKQISIIDEFDHQTAGLESITLLVVIIIIIVVLFLVFVFVVPMNLIKRLRSPLQCLKGFRKISTADTVSPTQLSINEYGDITLLTTSGSSQQLFINGRNVTGVEVSHELARRDLDKVHEYEDKLIRVGNKLGVHPAVVAGIISRQSQFGAALKPDGFGQSDGNCYGLMQINKHYHPVKGGPYSEEHLDHGVTFLIQLIKTMERNQPTWTKEKRLKGALACYIAGEEKVLPLTYEELDSEMSCGDFINDVIARAQWFAQNVFVR